MKKNLVYLFTLLFITACTQQKKMVVFGDKDRQLSFSDTHKKLETITTGDIETFEYEFTNTGKFDVGILNAVPTCGCITVKWSANIISPGEKDQIKVSFDSKGKSGVNKKSIVVQTSLPYPNDIIELSFEVNVNAK